MWPWFPVVKGLADRLLPPLVGSLGWGSKLPVVKPPVNKHICATASSKVHAYPKKLRTYRQAAKEANWEQPASCEGGQDWYLYWDLGSLWYLSEDSLSISKSIAFSQCFVHPLLCLYHQNVRWKIRLLLPVICGLATVGESTLVGVSIRKSVTFHS